MTEIRTPNIISEEERRPEIYDFCCDATSHPTMRSTSMLCTGNAKQVANVAAQLFEASHICVVTYQPWVIDSDHLLGRRTARIQRDAFDTAYLS